MRAYLNMHGLGDMGLKDPLGQTFGNQAPPNGQINTCAQAGHALTDPNYSTWFESVMRAGGNPVGGPAGPPCPSGIPDIICAQQRMNLSPAELACVIQTLAPYSPQLLQYEQYLQGQPATVGKSGGVQQPSGTGLEYPLVPGGPMPLQSGVQNVPSIAPTGTIPEPDASPSFLTLPWYYYAGGAALAWFLFFRGK